MSKKIEQIILNSDVIENTMEDVMHNSFMTYAEYVILERALPRVEDGLKPVQRRILYTMSSLGLTPDKPYKKSAKVVGEALAKYHPHGDTSVYDAMVRLAQDFVMRYPLTDGQGNFGSMDGDGAAAMRYTEAKMSPLALEMLRDLEKDTVPFRPNYDDSEMEPDILPSRFPNLLVNGASGIAVGLATKIPPHNISETIDATVYRMKNPDCSLEKVLKYIKGPDFPTGGIVVDNGDMYKAYDTGRGMILVRAKAHIEKGVNGKSLIVITEIPYDVKKSVMLQKVYDIAIQKKELFGGIDDVRDESDREGIRAVIEIKKGFDSEKILELLYKYTDMQVSFGYNMTVIANGIPVQCGLLEILDYYIKHQKNVVTRRTAHDLEKAEKREHILSGYIIAVADIDRVVKIIRGSKDAKDARRNLMDAFGFTGVQAQAILDMRLARLTSLEIVTLKEEYEATKVLIRELHEILESEDKLIDVIKNEMLSVKRKYGDLRRTSFIDSMSIETVDENEFKTVEDCVLILSSNGNLKRMTPKAFQKGIEAGIDVKNEPRKSVNLTDDGKLYVFTSKGNIYKVPVSSVPEGRIKDAGKPLSSIIAGVDKDDEIVNVFAFNTFVGELIFTTGMGYTKRLNLKELDIKKNKVIVCGLKEKDALLSVEIIDNQRNLLVVTEKGMAINFRLEQIPVMGRPGKGVGAIKISADDKVIYAGLNNGNGSNLVTFTNKGYAKKTSLAEYELQGRNGKGVKTFLFNADNGDHIIWAELMDAPRKICVMLKSGDAEIVNYESVVTSARYSKGEPAVISVLGNDVVSVQSRIFAD